MLLATALGGAAAASFVAESDVAAVAASVRLAPAAAAAAGAAKDNTELIFRADTLSAPEPEAPLGGEDGIIRTRYL
jgi:hypothetical protein